MTPDPDLQAALDAIYAVFSRYERPATLEVAPGRDLKRILAGLTARPLAQLTAGDIGGYMGWAMTTAGDVEDYKHFLPRILELAVRGPARDHLGGDSESLSRKIAYGRFLEWPADERGVVVTAFDAAWRQALRTSPDAEEAEGWLRGLILLGESVDERLTAWLAGDHLAGLHLADAIRSEAFRRENAMTPLGSGDEYAVYEAYSSWLESPAIRERLRQLLLEVEDEEAWRVGQALNLPMPPYPGAWRA